MKVKITHPVRVGETIYQAGLVYDVPSEVAQEIIEADKGFAVDWVGGSLPDGVVIYEQEGGMSFTPLGEVAEHIVKPRKPKKEGKA